MLNIWYFELTSRCEIGRDENISKMAVDSVDCRRPNVDQKSSVVDVDQLKTSVVESLVDVDQLKRSVVDVDQ